MEIATSSTGPTSVQTTRSFRALIVDDVAEIKLCFDASKPDASHLPQAIIDNPTSSNSKDSCAILSWRWDIDVPGPSRNLRAALRVARTLRKKYLFVNLVSIPQDQPKDQLLEAVLAFSELYKHLSVIAAYDKDDLPLHKNMLRPSISFECSQMKRNPFGVVYANHQKSGDRNPSSGEVQYTYDIFCTNFNKCCGVSGFSVAMSAFLVMIGTTSMTDIADFQYLAPRYTDLVSKAYNRMPLNDFLLTVMLLSGEDILYLGGYSALDDFGVEFSAYSIARRREPGTLWINLGGSFLAMYRPTVASRPFTILPNAAQTLAVFLRAFERVRFSRSSRSTVASREALRWRIKNKPKDLIWVDLDMPPGREFQGSIEIQQQMFDYSFDDGI